MSSIHLLGGLPQDRLPWTIPSILSSVVVGPPFYGCARTVSTFFALSNRLWYGHFGGVQLCLSLMLLLLTVFPTRFQYFRAASSQMP